MGTKQNTIKLVVTAFLMAMEVILTRFLSLFLITIRIGFGFLPVAITAILYGPFWAGAAYALGDLIGMVIFPTGPYFPGFTITAFLTGAVYGLILHKKPVSWKRTLLAASIVCIVLNLGLDTFWLYMLYDKGFFALLPTRLVKCAVMLPIQVLAIHVIWNRVLCKVEFLQPKKSQI